MKNRCLKHVPKMRLAMAFLAIMLLIFTGIHLNGASAENRFSPPVKFSDTADSTDEANALGRLAFQQTTSSSTGSGRTSVLSANADGTGVLTLAAAGTPPLFCAEPSWSPDGAKITYVSDSDIYTMNADGSNKINITNNGSSSNERNPSWSAAGKIAYERTGQIWTMNADGANQTQVLSITQPSPAAPAWSSDATKLAFTSGGEIWTINADGTNERRVTTNTTTDADPVWSPDGTKIVFGKGGSGIAVVNLDGTNETNLTNGMQDGKPAWSNDGTRIAFVRRGAAENGIFTMNAVGANQIRVIADVPSQPGRSENDEPAWQPVAALPNTLVVSGRTTRGGAGLSGVTITLSGSVSATATTDSTGNYQFSNLPNGGNYTITPTLANHIFTPPRRIFTNANANQIADFTAAETCSTSNCQTNGRIIFVRGSDIYTSSTDGSNLVNLTNESGGGFNADPSFSSDGTKIAFNKSFEIYRMNSDGTNVIRLTTNSITDRFPVFSPDGTKIIFVSNRDGNDEIYQMNADGTAPVRLTNDQSVDTEPVWSPDGTKIAFSKRSNLPNSIRGIFIMNADGTNQTQITNPKTTTANFLDLTPSFSPDGTKIVFSRYNTGPFTSIFYLMNSDGSNQTPFGTQGFIYNPSFSPDGTKIIYSFLNGVSSGRNDVATVNLDGTSVSTLVTFGSQPDWQPIRPASRRTSFDFDGDGRADVSVFRPSNGVWYLNQSSNGFAATAFGLSTDKTVPADYDGDGKTDLAVYRNGVWYLQRSQLGFTGIAFGDGNDIPVPADYDGDGKADIAVYRPSNGTWYLQNSASGLAIIAFGIASDKPVPADYNGDGKTDVALFRPSNGTWYLSPDPANNYGSIRFGAADDKPVPADYDGDGKADVAVYRGGTWYLNRSRDGFAGVSFGLGSDLPTAADYDGDGKADVSVFRNGVWYLNRTTAGFAGIAFGEAADKPVPNAFVQ